MVLVEVLQFSTKTQILIHVPEVSEDLVIQPAAPLPYTEPPLKPVVVQKFHTCNESSIICLLSGFSNKPPSLSLMVKPKLQAVGEKAYLWVNSLFLSEVAKGRKEGAHSAF